MKILLLLPLLLGFSVPAIAHNEANGGNSNFKGLWPSVGGKGEGADLTDGDFNIKDTDTNLTGDSETIENMTRNQKGEYLD